ncbi:hypothetical protein G3545_06035 [Starkeya sp. ORNL1]|uniref:DUF6894 family protein n=1 Tax=Starkeya sp. ORNL1 TaxID=2709380 RepID=UPI001463A065|nr:hypothetical protein [Starkeya sp. ORNL1]QJP13245.1 hypothetical protein G3545_06035 [Starkeya sp. ORNL1]
MPKYTFEMLGETTPQHLFLTDDNAAWSELVTLCGEILRDVDGKLPPKAQLEMRLSNEGGKELATLRIDADRHTENPT